LLHLAVAIWVPGCAVAAWWQVTVALAGDRLGWLYSVEWPCFAVFGAVVWWNGVHDDPDSVGSRALRRAVEPTGEASGANGVPLPATMAAAEAARDDPVPDDERLRLAEQEDPELAAYNRHLAALASSKASSGWRLPGAAGSRTSERASR
jgi:hypothetical protein